MKNLLYKEFRLAMHPTVILFLLLSALMLVPNYPYYVTFFYMALGLFFMCLNGREFNDIYYTASLPVRKEDIVKARLTFVIIVEAVQFLLAIPFAVIRQSYAHVPNNAVGIEANIAFFGMALILVGIYNYTFFTMYYKKPDRVGITFGIESVIFFGIMIIFEALVHVVPFFRDKMDTMDPQFMTEKLILLAVGFAFYVILTALTFRKSIKEFCQLDL